MVSLPMGSAPRGLQLSMGAQRGGGQGETGPLLSERTFVASQRKEATF